MKTGSTNEEPSVENSQVTAAFLVTVLGMVAAEEVICNTSGSSWMQPSEAVLVEELSHAILSPPLKVSPGLQNEARPESLTSITSLPEEQARPSIDSSDSNETSQARSSISLVDTNASTPPSARGKIHIPTKIVVDVVPTRLFYDPSSRLMGPDVDFAIAPEKITLPDTQHLTNGSNRVQEVESKDVAEVAQSGHSMPDGEASDSDVENPLTAQEIDTSDSTNDQAMLDVPEFMDSNQITTSVVREDTELEITTLQENVSKLQRDNKALASQSAKNYNEWQLLKHRVDRHAYSLEHEDPDTVAEANKVTKMLQEKYQLLEEANKQQTMELHDEYDDYMKAHQGEVDAVRDKLHKAQEEITYAEQCRDDYKRQLDDALFHQGLDLQDQQIISAFQSKETTLKREKENMSQLLKDERKKLHKLELDVTELRLSRGDAERKLEDAQDKIAQLISSNELLEARAETIDFGLTPEQRYEMERKHKKVEEMADELRRANETIAKIANANGDQTMAALMDSNAHKVNMLTQLIETNNGEISELRQKLCDLQYSRERDEAYAIDMVADMEELQIQYNAVNKDLRELREQLANGNHTLADPKSWQHMKECSEGREQAILLQKKAERTLEGYEQLHVDYQSHVCDLWRRMHGFEELMAPWECPAYLTENRDDLVARTLELCNVGVNDVDPQELAERVEEDMRTFGCYQGPHGTPANWLPDDDKVEEEDEQASDEAETPSDSDDPDVKDGADGHSPGDNYLANSLEHLANSSHSNQATHPRKTSTDQTSDIPTDDLNKGSQTLDPVNPSQSPTHSAPEPPTTIASSSTTPLSELAIWAEITADNYSDPQQVINDRLLAQHLAAHPDLLDSSPQPWISPHVFPHIDSSDRKDKHKAKARETVGFDEDGIFGKMGELEDGDLEEMVKGLERKLARMRGEDGEGEGREKTVRWADDVAAVDGGLEQVRYFRAGDGMC